MRKEVFGSPWPGVEYLDRPSAYGIAFDGQGRAAVVYCQGKGYFLLGGGMEPGETEEDCIRREALEETGFAVEIGEKVCIGEEYTTTRDGRPFHPTGHVYLVRLLEKIAEPTEPDHALTWMPAEEFQRATFFRYQSWAMELTWEAYQKQQQKESLQ